MPRKKAPQEAEVPTEEHTISAKANYYQAPVERAHLAKTAFEPGRAAADSELRLVVGARTRPRGAFEAVAFVEAKAGRAWKALEPVLTGKKAVSAIEKLGRAHARYSSVEFVLSEVLDGFEEQAQYEDG